MELFGASWHYSLIERAGLPHPGAWTPLMRPSRTSWRRATPVRYLSLVGAQRRSMPDMSEQLDNEMETYTGGGVSAATGAVLGADEFQALLVDVLPTAYGYALRLTRNRADAEDLVQDTALRAFRAMNTFEPGTNF